MDTSHSFDLYRAPAPVISCALFVCFFFSPILIALSCQQPNMFTEHFGFLDNLGVNGYDLLSLICPTAAYWTFSLSFHFLSLLELPSLEKYRVQPKAPIKNKISVPHVVGRVIFQQLLTGIITILMIVIQKNPPGHAPSYPLWIRVIKFACAMFILDTYQYWVHRFMHTNKYLYKTVHSIHHQLLMPYAFGALYNHPVEAFFLDILSGAVTIVLSQMANDPILAAIFVTFSTLKTVDDHCGYNFPWDPFQILFPNNCFYHDVHHNLAGIKSNYSQPYFVFWDRVMGTYINPHKFAAQSQRKDAQTTKNS